MKKMKRFSGVNLAVLAVVVFSLASATAAHAESRGGLLKFFNKSQGEDGAGPVHMDPNVAGRTGTPETKPFDLGRRGGGQAPAARYEDSSIHKEREAANKAFENWNANEMAKANASTEQVMAQFQTQLAYNKQMAQQQQAQLIAQAKANKTAGVAPKAGVDPAVLQAMKQSAMQSAYSGGPGYTAPVTAAGQPATSSPQEDPAAAPAKPPKERKSFQLFNKQE